MNAFWDCGTSMLGMLAKQLCIAFEQGATVAEKAHQLILATLPGSDGEQAVTILEQRLKDEAVGCARAWPIGFLFKFASPPPPPRRPVSPFNYTPPKPLEHVPNLNCPAGQSILQHCMSFLFCGVRRTDLGGGRAGGHMVG